MGQGDGKQVAWLEDLVAEIRNTHDLLLELGGGAAGEHTASLYAACARPFTSAFGEDLYTTAFQRAAAIFHAIICDHAFVDGNKRTGTAAALLILRGEGSVPDDAEHRLRLTMLGEVALACASGGMTVERVAYWIERIFAVPLGS